MADMPVRKVSAEQLLGGKTIVMSANPAILRGPKKLQEARAVTASSGRRRVRGKMTVSAERGMVEAGASVTTDVM